jgi:hypothetical protein
VVPEKLRQSPAVLKLLLIIEESLCPMDATPEYIAAQGCPESMISSVYAESQRLLSEGFDATFEP